MYSLNKIILAHPNPGHFNVGVFLGSHVDKCKARRITTDLQCGGAPGNVYKWWAQLTKYCRHSNLGDLNHLSVIKQSNVIDPVQKYAYMSWQLC